MKKIVVRTKEEGVIKIDGIKYKRIEQSDRDKIKRYIEMHPIGKSFCASDTTIQIKDEYLLLPLPTANTEWTFEIWDWVKAFIKRFEKAYPAHNNRQDCATFQYVDISSYKLI